MRLLGRTALIGYTGLVGSNILRQRRIEAVYNRANITEARGQEFDTLICAAAPGSMLIANSAPEKDLAAMEELKAQLARIRSRRMILISTIAVLQDMANGSDEGTQAFQSELAYGRHRRELEIFCQNHFEHCLILRLPALFGPGLRKNFIFDLLNPVPSMLKEEKFRLLIAEVSSDLQEHVASVYAPGSVEGMFELDRSALNKSPYRDAIERQTAAIGMSATYFHNPLTTYQYYDLSRLGADMERATAADLSCLHLAVEPLQAGEIHQRLLGFPMPETGAKLHHEDIHSRHASLWSVPSPYLEDRATILKKLSAFYHAEVAAR